MFSPHLQAYHSLIPHAVELDLEKYYDIYEISRIDMEDAELAANIDISTVEDADGLQDLKIGLQKLHTMRKLFLCTLLALNADGGNSDFQTWSSASETMATIAGLTAKMTSTIDTLIGQEDGKIHDRLRFLDG